MAFIEYEVIAAANKFIATPLIIWFPLRLILITAWISEIKIPTITPKIIPKYGFPVAILTTAVANAELSIIPSSPILITPLFSEIHAPTAVIKIGGAIIIVCCNKLNICFNTIILFFLSDSIFFIWQLNLYRFLFIKHKFK